MAKAKPIITPEAIRQKSVRLYPQFVRDWLAGTPQFPLVVRASLPTTGSDVPAMIAAVEKLRGESKEQRGFGYTIHWQTIRSRTFGENHFPQRIEIDTPDDLLRLAGRNAAFLRLQQAVDKIRSTFGDVEPLEAWFAVKANWEKLESDGLDVGGLLAVTQYFLAHPRPDCFARELPVPVDTKFIERNETILRAWLDMLLPPSAIDVNERKFARRFGLRDGELHYLVRLLDPCLTAELRLPFDELSLPLRHLGSLCASDVTAIIVENKVNLLTLPPRTRTIALGGVGNGVVQLAKLPWLANARILYWGDIDVDGFRILSTLRNRFPQVESILMDGDVLARFSEFAVPYRSPTINSPVNLTATERNAFDHCLRDSLRLEQERLPNAFVNAAVGQEASTKVQVS
ncbi:MAG: Wadjet anti-phage system protein JetD domain-containing protein [Planctomycetota bacterium]